MFSDSTRLELLQAEKVLISKLEDNFVYQRLQAVRQLLIASPSSSENQDTGSVPPFFEKERHGQLTTSEEREAMVKAAIQFWVANENALATIAYLVDDLQTNKGITIKGERAGTTLGATIGQRKELFELVDKKKGLWRMKPQAFATAKKEKANQYRSAA